MLTLKNTETQIISPMKHLMSEKNKNNPNPRQQIQEMFTIMTEINEIDTKTKMH